MTDAENQQVALIRGKIIDGFPTRPGYGTKGTSIAVRVNMFELNANADKGKAEVPLHKYYVDTGNEQLSKKKREHLVHAILQRPEFKKLDWATDYANIIVTTQKLKANIEDQVEVKDPNDDSLPGQPTTQEGRDAIARRMKRLRVTYEDTFSLNGLLAWLRRTEDGQVYTQRADVMQLLNIILQKPCRDGHLVATGGQSSFFPIRGHPCFASRDLGGGLSAYQGIFLSARYSVVRILINININHGAFFNDVPLRQLIHQMCGKNPVANNPGDKTILAGLEQKLNHLKVMTKYMRPRDANGKIIPKKEPLKKVRTFLHFSKTQAPKGKPQQARYLSCKETTFSMATGPGAPAQTISVFDYFRQHHSITLNFPDEPPVNVGTRDNKNWLPQELADPVLPGQAYRGVLQGDQTSEMIRFAATNPAMKALAIQGNNSDGAALRTLELRGADQAQSVEPFGFSVTPRMITVEARVLPPPRLEYETGQRGQLDPAFGSWNLTKDRQSGAHYKFFRPGSFQRWQTLTLDFEGKPRIFERQPEELMNRFGAELASYGIRFGQGKGPDQHKIVPNPVAFNPQARAKTNAILDDFFAAAEKNKVDILLVILREANPWLYSRIKYYGDIKHGVHTVCAVARKFMQEKGQGMLWGNLALKFNIKGGGVNHAITAAQLKPFDNKTIIFGIDVTHPSPTSTENAPSIAAVVANKDEFLCQWPASIRSQERRKEIVTQLKEMVRERFDLWRKCNPSRGLPDKVIVFRDGVSEGQYNDVLAYEASAFTEVFKDLYGDPKKHPKLAVFIVGKRHHIRAYATDPKDADRTGNLKPGTVIDRGITDPTRHDFYLQAHAVLQGTGRSAHYDTVRDDIKFSADELQTFTHHLSYLFNRATKSVSVVPPAYYADLACERGRQYLHSTLAEARTSASEGFDANTAEWTRDVHPRLRESTFYI